MSSFTPLKLTFVEYETGDVFGKFLAFCSMGPVFLVIAIISVILARREIHTLFFFAGVLLNEILNMILKRYFSQARPNIIKNRPNYGTYGMPSAHAQFTGYFTCYILCWLYLRVAFSDNKPKHFISCVCLILG
eukprot:Sdes_comp18750_c0_seq4m9127